MIKDKRVSSWVNDRWVRGSECERKTYWRQWSARNKTQLGEIQNAKVKKMFVYVF